jgi:hypothetical protein
MTRRPAVALALLVAASVSVLPAHAATKKPKPFKGSYTVNLLPDPTPDVIGQVKTAPVCGTLPQSMNKHPLVVPGAGKLRVHLQSADPAPPAEPLLFDWDLYLLDADGAVIDSSHTEFATEDTNTRFKRRTPLTILVCNLTGEQAGKVSYSYTP